MDDLGQCLAEGDLCFAHVKSFPWWPARIVSKLEKKSKRAKVDYFSVIFFGTAETANLPANELLRFSPESANKCVTKAAMRRKFFKEGYDEMMKEINLTEEVDLASPESP